MWIKRGTEADKARLNDAQVKSARWIAEGASLIDGVSFDTSNRNRVSVSLFHLAIEHQYAIDILVRTKLVGSAFALLRPMFEAYVRAAWYGLCATDRDIKQFVKENAEPPKIDTLIKDLERLGAFQDGMLARIKKDRWRSFCDFTHGGTGQVKARNTSEEVAQNFHYSDVANLITAAATLSQLACVGIAMIVDATGLANKLHDAYKQIYRE